jgi:hypothetical protein
MTGDTARRPFGILSQFVNDPVDRGFVHFLVRMVRPKVADPAGLRVAGLFQRKAVRGVATIASFLNDVAAFAEGGTDLLRDAKVLPLSPHAIPPEGMAALAEFLDLSGMAFCALFRKNHGLLLGSRLVIDVTGDAMDTVLRVL